MADGLVQGTVTLNNQTIAAEYYISGATARLGSGYNSCIPQYSSGKVEVPASIIVNNTTYPVTEISTYAFRMCSHITEVVLPEGVTRIGDFAFVSCPSLQKATLPSTLTTIGAGAFIGLSSLQEVVICATTPPVWEYNDVFCFHNGGIGDSQSYHTNQVTLTVPSGTVRTYRNANFTNASLGWTTADGWSYFNNIVPNTNIIFVNEGNWNEATNWSHGEVPAAGEDVFITADVTIPSGYTANVDAIDLANGVTLTIADGGQFFTNVVVDAIVEKHVSAVSDWEEGDDGWMLIASPLEGTTGYTSASSNHVENLVVDDYNGNTDDENHFDFYRWNGSCDKEWRNYRSASFDMNNGQGYLYAARENRLVTFTGTVKANAEAEVLEPLYSENGGLEALTLYGNPFVCDAYLVMEEGTLLAFYVMNEEGTNFMVSEGPIAPMQGFFVFSTTADQRFSISRNAPMVRSNSLCMSLLHGSRHIDKAMLRFGEGNMLPKVSFCEDGCKVYVPVDGKDFAAVNAEAMGEMPICFQAVNNGDYTLCFNTENMNFGYLHLVDNLTGDDVDLLAQPDYSFKAKKEDYASRFKLVFCAKDASTGLASDENFAFFSNGRLIVANEGESILQLVDVAGRVVSSETVIGSCSVGIDATHGLYLLRLVSGEKVKTQKIVVR
jgi:hypothetical protein